MSGAVVVARRSDGLAARLTSMVNAIGVSEALGLQFRFVWPRGGAGAGPADDDPRLLFEPGFLEAHEIDDADLDGRPVVRASDFLAAPDDGDVIVDLEEYLHVTTLHDEPEDAARARFQRCFRGLGWSPEVEEIMRACAEWSAGRTLAVVHVRAGDIVTGDWRQLMFHSKYMPTPYVEAAIAALTRDEGTGVLLMSDHAEYLAWLKQRYNGVVTTAEIVPGYDDMHPVHQALADILAMSCCTTIVGTPTSAFSRLASHVGGGVYVRADAMVEPGRERDVLRAGLDRRGEAPFWSALTARDLCWYVDVFGEELGVADQLALLRRAIALDPEFSGAHARIARLLTLDGDYDAAAGAAAQAARIAEAVTWHLDALMEALATQAALEAFAAADDRLVLSPTGLRFIPSLLRSGRVAGGKRQRLQIVAGDAQMNLLKRLLGRSPAARRRLAVESLRRARRRAEDVGAPQLDRDAILAALDALIATTAGRPTAPASTKDYGSRLDHHRAVTVFDPVALDLAHMSRMLRDRAAT